MTEGNSSEPKYSNDGFLLGKKNKSLFPFCFFFLFTVKCVYNTIPVWGMCHIFKLWFPFWGFTLFLTHLCSMTAAVLCSLHMETFNERSSKAPHMPFPALAEVKCGCSWRNVECPLWGQLLRWQCPPFQLEQSCQPAERGAQKWTLYFLITVILAACSEGSVTDLCCRDFGKGWLAPASPAELCCPGTAFSAFVKTLFLVNFL